MNEVETAEIFERFLNEVGMWQKFEEFIKKEGYTLDELGFEATEEDDD